MVIFISKFFSKIYLSFLLITIVVICLTACNDSSLQQHNNQKDNSSKLINEGFHLAKLTGSIVNPIVNHPAPKLPVTVTSAGHKNITITDISRIITVDIFGTLAQIVFNLGLGNKVVARDTATVFPAARKLPQITTAGMQLKLESILREKPTIVLTDGSLGPIAIFDQLIRAGVKVVFLLIKDPFLLIAV